MSGKGSDHGRVISLLQRSADVNIQTVGSMLHQLHDTRKSADYDVGRVKLRGGSFNPLRSQMAVLMATKIIEEVAKAEKADRRLFIPSGVI